MVFTDDGIAELQKVGIRNESGETPLYMSFAGSDNTYNGNETSINQDYVRKAVSWEASGIQSVYTVALLSTEAVGSYIGTIGLTGGPNLGSDVLFTIDESFIGTKTASFNVQVEGEIIIQRA